MRSQDLRHFGPVRRDPLENARRNAAGHAPELYDAIKNLMGCFDTPIMRRRLQGDDFALEAIRFARDVVGKVEGKN